MRGQKNHQNLPIETNQKKNFMASLSSGCASLSFDTRVPKKLATTAPSTNWNAIWRYFMLLRLCLALLFFISIGKSKSPEVPFHGITSTFSYFKVIWIFGKKFLRQLSKKQNMIKKIYQLNRNKKFVDKAQQCFVILHIKPKFKFALQWIWFLET